MAFAVNGPFETIIIQSHIGCGKGNSTILGWLPSKCNGCFSIELLQSVREFPGNTPEFVKLFWVCKLAVLLRDPRLEILNIASALNSASHDKFKQPSNDRPA